MSELFQTSLTNVVEHIKHIYEEGELDEISTCRDFRQVRKEGNREVTRQITKPLILIDFKSRRLFALSGTVYIATLTKWLNLCKRDKALAHFEGGYRSGYDGQKRKNEESFNHFKCITRYYIYTDIQWKGV